MTKGWLALVLAVLLAAGGIAFAQKWQQVAVLVTDASRDETTIEVDSSDQIVVDKDVLLETRDGKQKDSYAVKHVYDRTIILKEKLRKDFVAGSRVYQ